MTLLLDFDGTLSPLVRRPHLARISPSLKSQINTLSRKPNWTVAVVSGRDLKTVKKKMGLSHLIYAGNHGYEIQFPNRKVVVHPAARRTKKLMAVLCRKLKKNLASIKGTLIENKIYSASLHTRTLSPFNETKACLIFHELVKGPLKRKQIKVTHGKKVLEIRPPAPWDKGKAVLYILKKLKKPGFPIYIGDDRTDEDAFKVLKKRGLGIRVGKTGSTKAQIRIKSVGEMSRLIKVFGELI